MSKTNKEKGPHQAKNKISDVQTKENDFEVVDQNSADERKTVIVDKDFENLEFDDKVWLWWRENKTSAIIAVVAALIIIVVVNAYKMMQNKATLAAQVAYNECSDNASLENFAKEYSYSELAGLAALQLADSQFTSGDFAKAQSSYAKALESLSKNELAPKAQLGIAFAQLKQGKTEEATKNLQEVSQSAKANPAYKAEATYQLAVLEYSNDKKDLAKSLFDSLAQNPMAGVWAMQAQLFIRANY